MSGSRNRKSNVYNFNKEPKRVSDDNEDKLYLKTLLNYKPFNGIDYTVLIIVILLIMFGLIMVFSSSYYYAMTEEKFGFNKFHFFNRQLRWALVGIVAMIGCMSINVSLLRRFSGLAYMVIIAILAVVLVIGVTTKGSNRWLDILGTSFQPSELAKFVIIIFMSNLVIKYKHYLNGDFKEFILCALPLGLAFILIASENLSTGLVVMAVGIMIMFVASNKIKNFFICLGMAVAAFILLIIVAPYRMARITGWLDPWSDPTDTGYQIIQSLYAVASGGLFGIGIGQSRQKTFIPESYNDIIYAIICEELGLIGAFVVIILFALLIWRGIKIAMTAKDKYASYMATGIITMIAVQVIINIAVVTNSIPNTGMPMPFISYGGTSLVVMMASIGLLLNISRDCKDL